MVKLDECYNISSNIMEKYYDLVSTFSLDDEDFTNYINEIKCLVAEEYELFNSKTMEVITSFMSELNDNSKYDNPIVVSRIKNKLTNAKYLLLGIYFEGKDLDKNDMVASEKFSIYDAIMAVINIQVIKLLKKKTDLLNGNFDNEIINELKRLLEISKINLLFSSSASEFISFAYDSDIDKIQCIKIEELNKLLKKRNFGDKFINAAVYNTLAVYAKNTVDILATMTSISDNPSEVFKYLMLMSQIEVLASGMDKNTLIYLDNYCAQITNDQNKDNMSTANKLIKSRILK